MQQLESKINQLLNSTQDKTSVLIQFINESEPLFDKDSAIQSVSASTIKVPIMFTAFHEVMLKNMTLDQMIPVLKEDILDDSKVFEYGPKSYSLEELVSWMIISSDNTATNVLIRTLGMDKINKYITETLQLNSTRLERIMLDFEAIKQGRNNYTSQQDQYKMYRMLFNHEILNDELCEKALEILSNQRDKALVMRYIPFKTEFAHKTGGLDYLSHDCGIMKIGNQNIYIGVSIWDSSDIEGNGQLAGQIGRLIYDTLKKGM